jgi:hypothetical protein
LKLHELLAEGPPVSPADLAEAIGMGDKYVRKLIAGGALEAVRMPNAGASGRAEYGRWRIPRRAAQQLAADLGLVKSERLEQSEQWHAPSSAAPVRFRIV